MEIVHQGYLLSSAGTSPSDPKNPAVQHYSKVEIVDSFNLKNSKIMDSSDSMRPKSFGLQSTTNGSFAEFVCPTNSVKFQWVKHLQVQSLSASMSSPVDRRLASGSLAVTAGGSLQVQVPPPAVSNPSPSPQPGMSRLMASRNLAAKVLTPVPRISYNTGMLDQALCATPSNAPGKKLSLELQEMVGSGKVLVEDGLPKWIPSSFGNKQHSSLALSPSPPRSRSAGRLSNSLKSASGEMRPETSLVNSQSNIHAKQQSPRPVPDKYDVLASRAAPQRSSSAANPRIRNRDQAPIIRDGARNEPQLSQEGANRSTTRTPQPNNRPETTSNRNHHAGNSQQVSSTPDPSQQLLSKSMSNMTVAEIRAALMSMPATVRHTLVDSNSPKHTHPHRQERRATYHSGGSPEYPVNQSAHNDTNNSSSLHEYYDERGRQDRFQQFSGDRYPAVGEFYAEDRVSHARSGRQQDTRQRGRRELQVVTDDHRRVAEYPDDSAADYEQDEQESELEREQDHGHGHGLGQRQEQGQYNEQYSDAEETESSEDIPEYHEDQTQAQEQDQEREYEREQEYAHRGRGRDFRAHGEGYEEELEHCGEYEHQRGRGRSERTVDTGSRNRRASAPAGRLSLHASSAEYSTADEGSNLQRRSSAKPQLPPAARRSSATNGTSAGRATPQAEYTADRRPAQRDNSGRESHIPRPVEPSPRGPPASNAQSRHHQQPEADNQHSQPAWGYRNQDGRAKSAQRLPARDPQRESHGKRGGAQAWAEDPYGERDQRASSAGTSERVRYLPEQQRKETLEWSRKQAAERKLRSNFTSSPVRAVSPGVTPAIKLKYRSFNNSVEKEFASNYEGTSEAEGRQADRRTAPPQRHDAPAHSSGHSSGRAQHTDAPIAQHRALSASRASAQPRAEAPASSRGANSGSAGNKSRSKSPMFKAFDSKPGSFFEFRNSWSGSNPRPVAADSGDHSASTTERKVSPPLKNRSSGPASTPSADSFIRSNTQLLANYQHPQRSPGRGDRSTAQDAHVQTTASTAHPARSGAGGAASSTITNVAEWRRLTDWLGRTGMQKYEDVLRVNGITKLSMVELMEPEDMRLIGIAPGDISLFQNNVSEFTNRTRSFSEQVLGKTGNTPPSSPTNVPYAGAAARHGAPRPHPAAARPIPSAAVANVASKAPPHAVPTKQVFAPSLREKEQTQRPAAPAERPTGTTNRPATAAAPTRKQSSTELPEFNIDESDSDALLDAVVGLDEHIFSDVDSIRRELHRCFDCGERELFFHAWKQLVLYMPEDCITLNPLHPAFYHAKQVIEFNLHLHFAVFPITHNMGKRAEKAGKLALKRYFESMMITSEMDALNRVASDQQGPTGSEAEARDAAGADTSKLLNSSMYSAISPKAAHSFTRSREYATYAGIVLVPEPQENIAFQTLFQPDWMESLRARLEQFLQLMSPNVEIVPTASSSIIAAAEASEAAEMAETEARRNNRDDAGISAAQGSDGASIRSGREKVRSFLHVKEPVGAPKGTLNDFEIAFHSPIATQNDQTRASPPISAIKGAEPGASSPTDLDITTKLEQDVVSPLAMSPTAEEHKRHISTKHSDDGGAARLSRIASPASPVSSIISQLTDDSHRPAAAPPVTATEPTAAAHAASSAPGAPTSARKPKLKPYGSTTKKAMQSQVDMYNKLLKKNHSPLQDQEGVPSLVPMSAEHSSQPQTEAPLAPQRSPDQHHSSAGITGTPSTNAARRAGASNGTTTNGSTANGNANGKVSSLNVGFGMKRKPVSDLPAPDQSLAAQVARYNKLLAKSTDSGDAQGRASVSEHVPPSSADEANATEAPDADKLGRSTSGVETTEESELTPGEAQEMQEALLEIQNIYSNTGSDEAFFGAATNSDKSVDHVAAVGVSPANVNAVAEDSTVQQPDVVSE